MQKTNNQNKQWRAETEECVPLMRRFGLVSVKRDHSDHVTLSPVQTDATLLNVTCCFRLHTLLHVVGCCWVLLRKVWNHSNCFQSTTPNISFVPWSPKRSTTMLDPFAQLFQHCWGHARSLRMDYKDLWVVFFPRCTAGPKLVGSCCIRLHTTANTRATTPNTVGATMSGVVAFVCTQP